MNFENNFIFINYKIIVNLFIDILLIVLISIDMLTTILKFEYFK